MKVTSVRINCHNRYVKKEGEGSEYEYKDVYEGKIEFSDKLGEISVNADEELCNLIIAACLEKVSKQCSEQIQELNKVYLETVSKIKVDSVLSLQQTNEVENNVPKFVTDKEEKLIPRFTKFIKGNEKK